MKKILFVLGSVRDGRKSEQVAKYVLSVAKNRSDLEPVFVDVRDFPQTHTLGLSKELSEKWNGLVSGSSGLIIIAPEYNHGYPGELKLLLDSAYEAYKNKPVAICGVSSGPYGGVRMAENLKPVLSAFQMIIINTGVYFTNAGSLFSDSVEINNKEFWDKNINGMIDEVLKY